MQYVVLAPVAILIWGATLFPIVAGIWGLINWRGGWRVASAVPVLVVLGVLAPVLANPHGWWGLLFIPLAMLASAYSGVVVLLHRRRESGR